MITVLRRPNIISPAIIACLFGVMAGMARADEAAEYRKFLQEEQSVLVTVKFVLKLKMGGMMGGGGEQESENEVTGIMIGERGLVLCSNTQLGGMMAMFSRMMGPMGGNMSATPTDLKVLVGDDTEGVDAELIARDTELDLAWIRISEPGDKMFEFLDFSKSASIDVGQRVLLVRKMDKYFGRAPVVIEGRIAGVTVKPRKLYVPSGELMAALGLPVYLPNGTVVGVPITQSSAEEGADANPMAMLSMMSGMQEQMSGLILPAAEVVRATERALSREEDE